MKLRQRTGVGERIVNDRRIKFLFDLDGTLTAEETLPIIGREFGRGHEIAKLTEQVISGTIPFVTGFLDKVRILGDLDVNKISTLLTKTRLNPEIVDFILEDPERAAIVTGNFRGWIEGLVSLFPCEVFASEGLVGSDNRIEITSVLRKEDVVREFQAQGYKVVFIGEGNNDSEAMRWADVSIGFGLVHQPANSVLEIADYLIYCEKALVRLLQQIASPSTGTTLVLSAAGTGSRLGIGQTKGLLDFYGHSLISHQLSLFSDVDDLRVVIGFQGIDLVSEVLKHRDDVLFVFNHNYKSTGTAMSVYLGSLHGREQIIAWDADTIVHPDDVETCLASDSEFLGVSKQQTEEGIFAELDEHGRVMKFTKTPGPLEWTGPAKLNRSKILATQGNLFEMLEVNALPLPSLEVRAMDVDTPSDYETALQLYKSWYLGNRRIHEYYDHMAQTITSPLETRNNAPDSTKWDVELVLNYASATTDLLDLGSGTGLLVNQVAEHFRSVTAVEKYREFSRFIETRPNVSVVNADVLTLEVSRKFQLITLFGLMNFFSDIEAEGIYRKVFEFLEEGGRILVKHQMGIRADVIVTGFSEELGVEYFSNYRGLEREKNLLREVGLQIEEVFDIYPAELNRWQNTHFYALVATRPPKSNL